MLGFDISIYSYMQAMNFPNIAEYIVTPTSKTKEAINFSLVEIG